MLIWSRRQLTTWTPTHRLLLLVPTRWCDYLSLLGRSLGVVFGDDHVTRGGIRRVRLGGRLSILKRGAR